MKIAIDVTPMKTDGSVGGVMNLCVELIDGLSKEDDVQLVLLCAYWNKEFLKKYSSKDVTLIEVIKNDKTSNKLNNLYKKIRNKLNRYQNLNGPLKKSNVDILFCPFSAATYKEAGIPTVSTINDIQHEYYPQFFTPEENNHRTNFYRDIAKKVQGIICISNYTKETFCEKYDYDPLRAYTIYISIQNRFQIENPAILDKLKLKDTSYIVYPANFWEHKNHKILLNAFSMYARLNKDVTLVLTGNTLGLEKEYREIIEIMGIGNQVVIAGYLTNEEYYSVLKNSKGLIFPSLFEGFGIPVVEAMHINKLVACSNVTSLPEIGSEAAYYFNPTKPDSVYEGIEYLFTSEVSDTLIDKYKKQLERYDFKIMLRNYIDVFQKVINEKYHSEYSDVCDGIYADRWSGSNIQIQLANKKNSYLTMNIELPEFVKHPIKFSVFLNHKEVHHVIKPGQSLEFNWDINEDVWNMMLTIKKAWVPSEILQNGDSRQLGFMIKKIELVTKNKNVSQLI